MFSWFSPSHDRRDGHHFYSIFRGSRVNFQCRPSSFMTWCMNCQLPDHRFFLDCDDYHPTDFRLHVKSLNLCDKPVFVDHRRTLEPVHFCWLPKKTVLFGRAGTIDDSTQSRMLICIRCRTSTISLQIWLADRTLPNWTSYARIIKFRSRLTTCTKPWSRPHSACSSSPSYVLAYATPHKRFNGSSMTSCKNWILFSRILMMFWSHPTTRVSTRDMSNRFQQYGIAINPAKCVFNTDTLSFLGHVIDKNACRPNAERVAAICEWPLPTTKRELQRFLGVIELLSPFHSKCHQNTSVIIRPRRRN